MAFLDGSRRMDSVIFLSTASLLLLCSCVPSNGVDDMSVILPSSTVSLAVPSSLYESETLPDSGVRMPSSDDQDMDMTSSFPNDGTSSSSSIATTTLDDEDEGAEELEANMDDEETSIITPHEEDYSFIEPEDANVTNVIPPLSSHRPIESSIDISRSFIHSSPSSPTLQIPLITTDVPETSFAQDFASKSLLEPTKSLEQMTESSFESHLTSHISPTISFESHLTSHISPTTSFESHLTSHISPTPSFESHLTSHISPTTNGAPYLTPTVPRSPKLNFLTSSSSVQTSSPELHSPSVVDELVPSSSVSDSFWSLTASDIFVSPTAVVPSSASSEPRSNYITNHSTSTEGRNSWTTLSPPPVQTHDRYNNTTTEESADTNASPTPPSSTATQSPLDMVDSVEEYFLVLGANCSKFSESEGVASAVNRSLVQAGLSNKVRLLASRCSIIINVSLTVSDLNGSRAIHELLSSALRKIDLKDESVRVLRVMTPSRDESVSTSFPPSDDLMPQEVIAYIVVGVLFGILLLAAIVVVCAKCVCRRQNSKMELYDLPHVSLNVEDYKLTTIPRPSLVYTDGNRDSTAGYVDGSCRGNGFVQSDGAFQENRADGERQMKTFGRRKPYNGSQVKSDPGVGETNASNRMSNTPVPIADRWSSNDALTSSTNITDVTGIENPNYRKWF